MVTVLQHRRGSNMRCGITPKKHRAITHRECSCRFLRVQLKLPEQFELGSQQSVRWILGTPETLASKELPVEESSDASTILGRADAVGSGFPTEDPGWRSISRSFLKRLQTRRERAEVGTALLFGQWSTEELYRCWQRQSPGKPDSVSLCNWEAE